MSLALAELDSNPQNAIRTAQCIDAREKLLDFTTYTKDNYLVGWHQKLICNTIDEFLDDPNRDRLMIFAPPRHGKSEIVSRRLPAYYFGKNPDKKIIATSYSADLAVAMSRDTQRIMDSQEYREVFPDTTLNSVNTKTTSRRNYKRTADEFEIVSHDGTYKCAGVCGGITGQGADLCGKFDTPVLTVYGYRPINTLKIGDLVWSYNHESSKLELKPVTNILRRRTTETVTVTTSSGRKSIFTPDHPYYTTGSGYVEAQDITRQDELIQETIYAGEKVQLLTVMQLLWCNIREVKHRLLDLCEKGVHSIFLFSRMFSQGSKEKIESLSYTKLQQYCKQAKSGVANMFGVPTST